MYETSLVETVTLHLVIFMPYQHNAANTNRNYKTFGSHSPLVIHFFWPPPCDSTKGAALCDLSRVLLIKSVLYTAPLLAIHV